MASSCCPIKKGSKGYASASKAEAKVCNKKHELDTLLQTEAGQTLAKHYLKLAQEKDNKRLTSRLFGFVVHGASTERALENLEAALDMKRTDVKSFSRLA